MILNLLGGIFDNTVRIPFQFELLIRRSSYIIEGHLWSVFESEMEISVESFSMHTGPCYSQSHLLWMAIVIGAHYNDSLQFDISGERYVEQQLLISIAGNMLVEI